MRAVFLATNRVLFERLAMATTVATFILMMMGGYVKAIGAGLACPDWPHCYGTWYPFVGGHIPEDGFPVHMVAWEWIHRFTASLVGPMILAVTVLAWRLRPVDKRLRFFATSASVLLPIQVGVGGLTVLKLLKPVIVVSHLGFATLIFASLVATTTLAYTLPREAAPLTRAAASPVSAAGVAGGAGPPAAPVAPEARAAGVSHGVVYGKDMTSRPWTGRMGLALGPWFELIKPGILFLLVLCGAAAMFIAGTPSWRLIAVTLFGGALAASSAAAFNNVLDRERDAKMARTAKRAVPSARIPVPAAWTFAFATEIASFAVLTYYVNLLTASLALASVVFYVFYTVYLKPTTAQNIVIGGAAGAGPALVGWAAVTGEVALPAVLLGFIIFLWTPPHFWALALVYKKDYESAAVPMYPVVKGEAATRKQIFVYTLLTVAATLAFVPLKVLGLVYAVSAVVLGAWFVYLAAKLLVDKSHKTAYRVFGYSIVYLALLFGAMVLDRVV